ncbi:MAG TPA: hypothetical protein VF283_19075 [Bryobacteraceae bacterium]
MFWPYPVSLEYVLMLGYAVMLAMIALVLELAARHTHRRSVETRTIGFTYHPEHDIWKCPKDQHLFPIFSESSRKVAVYRAPASACNACRSKADCTDSNNGRQIERRIPQGLEYGMQRFHRAMSVTLLVLGNLILAIEFIRSRGLYPRLVLLVVFIAFCLAIRRLVYDLRPKPETTRLASHLHS